MELKKIIFIVGPTAVRKTQVAFLLAKKIKGEIISCDSMQVYKEVSIASNKPNSGILKEIPHHLIDVISITEEFNVSDFRNKALKAINRIHKKNKIPVIVGGSGLYMNVLLDGIFKEGPKNPSLRKKLEKIVSEKGNSFLYRQLQKKDPDAAKKIHLNDTRRVIRAMEVVLSTKRPISTLQKDRQGLWGRYNICIFALDREREELYTLINQRVDKMFKDGLLEEVKKLSKRKWSRTARAIIGVKEINDCIKGECDLDRAKYLIKLNTRHYAKRQLTWFRKDKRLKWIMIDEKNTPSKIVRRLLKTIGK